MIDWIQALIVILEEGSINRAAARLRITQPALSRHMQALEAEIGGRLLERGTSGVKPTSLCHSLVKTMEPILNNYQQGISEIKILAQGHGNNNTLKIGYLISTAQTVITPTLKMLREHHPELKIKLMDMSPKEQIEALENGDIDIALIGQEGNLARNDFYSKTVCNFGVCAALSSHDPLAEEKSIRIDQLADRPFIGINEEQMPGRNQWVKDLCRLSGFKPRFVSTIDGITHVLSMVDSESAVALLPNYFRHFMHPGVVYIPISDETARWEFTVLWQRGKVPTSTKIFIDTLSEITSQTPK